MAQKKRDNNTSDSRGSKKGKFDMNPFNFIEQGKNKLENFYKKLQKDRAISKKRSEKQRIINEKRELELQKKQAQREKEERIKEEKYTMNIEEERINRVKELLLENQSQMEISEQFGVNVDLLLQQVGEVKQDSEIEEGYDPRD